MLLLHTSDDRRLPRAVEDCLVGPARTDIERERAIRRGQPVAFLVLARRCGPGIKRQRTIRVVLEGFVFRTQRIAPQRVRINEMLLLVQE